MDFIARELLVKGIQDSSIFAVCWIFQMFLPLWMKTGLKK